MAGIRPPGPVCVLLRDLSWIDNGTMCRQLSPTPGPTPSAETLQKAKKRQEHHGATKAPASSHTVPTTREGFLQEIKGFEGIVPHMYRDSKGFVTVGIGFLIE